MIVVFQTPTGVHRNAEVAARGVLGGDSAGFGRCVDSIEPAVRERRTRGGRGIRGELNSFEAVCQQAQVALQAVKAGPHAIGTQIDEVIEIQIDPQLWCIAGAVVEKTGVRSHLQPA